MTEERRFRVIRGQSKLSLAERMTWPESLPWSLVEQWRERAELNHNQTLERLNERGGLAPEELWAAAHGKTIREWREWPNESEAGRWLVDVASGVAP